MKLEALWMRVVTCSLRVALWCASLGRRLNAGQAGQSMVEYAIVAALIAVVAMVTLEALGTGIASVFQNIVDKVQGAGGGGPRPGSGPGGGGGP